MSYTLSAQKDVHVDSKKDMHVDDSDLFLQIDKLLVSTVKKIKPSSKNGFIVPSKAVLPLWIIFGYLFLCFHCSLTVTSFEGLASWLACM